MNSDDLRALAGKLRKLQAGEAYEAADYLRACADAQPVGILTVARFRGHLENRAFDYTGELPDGNYPLYTRPAPSAAQAEPTREDRPVRDLLAIIHCDGGHHTEAVGLDQSIKDAQAAVCELKRELVMGKREPLSEEQMRAVLIAEARWIAAQAGEKDPDSLAVDEEMLAQVMLAGRAVERAHGIGGQRC